MIRSLDEARIRNSPRGDMPNFRYLKIRDGFQKGAQFDGYGTFGYWTVEKILDENLQETDSIFLEKDKPKTVTVIINPVSMKENIKPALTDLPPFISYSDIPAFDPNVTNEFTVTLTCNTDLTGIYSTKVTGTPLPARTKGFSIFCSFGWTVGSLSEIGWTVGILGENGWTVDSMSKIT